MKQTPHHGHATKQEAWFYSRQTRAGMLLQEANAKHEAESKSMTAARTPPTF